ncbi:hypothetical protein EG244_19190 [Falsigemmobacter faecalis]|uniref:Uncharacterized protein n=1 Tax=Falsigemmobacter faecalis TaxID=2488730 RepID=A0A3P3D423_9RHOB|nr:hypothetical protein EG244_19190 [Falsigemmobacter faecalis]
MSELASRFGLHPTMIHQGKRAQPDGASDIFERGRRKVPVLNEEHACQDRRSKPMAETVANSFLERALRP